ncbi:MAG: hypothetical protein ACREE7_05325 [Dongiaceae bacterium]
MPTRSKTISATPESQPFGRARRASRPLRPVQERLLLGTIFALGALLQLLAVLDAAGIVVS